MKRNYLVIAVIILVVIPPIVGYSTSTLIQNKTETTTLMKSNRSIGDLQSSLNKDNEITPDEQKYNGAKIISFEKENNIWYVAKVSFDGSNNATAVALIGDVHKSEDSLEVILRPHVQFQYINISNSLGVPYDVINKINTFYQNQANQDEESGEY